MIDEPVPQARVGSVAPPVDGARTWRTAKIAAGVGCCAWMIAQNPIAGTMASALGAVWLTGLHVRRSRWAARWKRDIEAVYARLRAGDLDAADELLRRRERIPTNAVGRAVLAYYRGELEWARGDLDGALGCFLDCTRSMPRAVQGFQESLWRARFYVASLQLELGQLTSAETSCARAFEAPRLPALEMFRVGLETHHAFAHDRPDELGDAKLLAPRATVARANQQPLVMAVIAWAYQARGSIDTAILLRDEARGLIAPDRAFWRTRFPRTTARLATSLGLTDAGPGTARP